jgi:uncharacterized protein YbjT (DUF2867 family)
VKILVLGASGFIGTAVCARLGVDGFSIRSVSRGKSPFAHPDVEHVRFDMSAATDPEAWLPILSGIGAVVNCAGALQDSSRDDLAGVHVTGLASLISACERCGVLTFVHISAAGVSETVCSDFSRTKLQGDELLMRSSLNWVILRPSVVIGRRAYGGSALMRGLAASPIAIPIRRAGVIQPVHLDDVVETVAQCLKANGPKRMILDLVGPQRYSLETLVAIFRRWLRFRPARTILIPEWAIRLFFRLGDLAGLLGWRSPVRSNALWEMRRGATGNNDTWMTVTGITPRNIEVALAQEPASVQERWFAPLYLLKPVVFVVFGLFWVATGVISFGPGWPYGMELLREGGLGYGLSVVTLSAGALADILIGIAILYRPTARLGLLAALAISITYAIVGTILVPRLWADPLGPMLKIWPVIVLNMVALAVLKDR